MSVESDQIPATAPGPQLVLWERIRRLWGEPALVTVPGLRKFLSERAAFVAQKSAVDYCRGKTGLFSFQLFAEKPFIDALAVCRWETFAATLGDVIILAEGALRPVAGGEAAQVAESLAALYRQSLLGFPLPQHRPQGWDDAVGAFRLRFDAATHAPPRIAAEVAMHSARRLFETLPIHPSMREWDEEIVHGSVCFRMVSVRQEMERRFDKPALIRELVRGGER